MALKKSLYYREFKGGDELPGRFQLLEAGDLVRTEALAHLDSRQRSQFDMAVKFNALGVDESEMGLTVIPHRRTRKRRTTVVGTNLATGEGLEKYRDTCTLPLSSAEPEVILHPRDLDATPAWVEELYLARPWYGWGQDTGGTCVEWPSVKNLSHTRAPFVAVIVTTHNKPDRCLPCIQAIVDRTVYPNMKLFVVDDGGEDFTHDEIQARFAHLGEKRIEILRHRNCGYLQTANRGARHALRDNVEAMVFVNSDVIVTHGWLSAMVRGHLRTGADIVNPMCNQQGPISLPLAEEASMSSPRLSGGVGYKRAGMICSFLPPKYPPATPAIGACMLVTSKAWEKHGPFDASVYGSGYGEECELWAALVDDGGRAIVADDAFVYHESHGVHKDAVAREKRGFDIFMSRWGKVYRQKSVALRLWPDKTAPIRELAKATKPGRCPVRFVMVNIGPYGGVYCALRLVDELNERGFDATAEYVLKQEHQFKLKTGPRRHTDIAALRGLVRKPENRGGFVVGTHWYTGEVMASMFNLSDDFIPVAFWQDREDMFVDPDGTRPVSAASVAAYTRIPNRIVNARWVGESAKQDLEIDDFMHIPVGVDTLKFYPGKRNGGPVRVLVMHRPSTPRRGAARMRKLYPKLKKKFGEKVLVETFGEPCTWSDHHYGHLSQDGVAEILRQVDVLVEPSEYQGFGLPGLEALATGVCLVSTDNKGIHEYGVHNENCLIEGEKSLLDLIIEAIEDKPLRRRLGEAGRISSLNFDWGVVADRWAKHLCDLYRKSGLTQYVDVLPDGR